MVAKCSDPHLDLCLAALGDLVDLDIVDVDAEAGGGAAALPGPQLLAGLAQGLHQLLAVAARTVGGVERYPDILIS